MTETQWLAPLLWAGLYISDYCFTIACARLYQAQSTIVFEGSYEITPIFQADVNALRRFSPRFVAILVASTAYVWWVARVSSIWDLYICDVAIGALVLIQLTVHLRHLRNWFLFRAVRRGSIAGCIEYPRGIILRASAFELLSFGGLYTWLFVVTHDRFVLGGAIACALLSLNHYQLSRRHDASRTRAENRAVDGAHART
jgi:hypothetical protein